MKILSLVFLIVSFSYAQSYTFLLNKYDKELELESKIIEKIASSSLSKDIVLFIPKITEAEKKIYSKIFTIGRTCEESNFVFVKKNSTDESLCKNKLYFTNNYKKLLSNNKFFGAFFWSKSRPNIVFIKSRLAKNNISLPNSYYQFVEDL